MHFSENGAVAVMILQDRHESIVRDEDSRMSHVRLEGAVAMEARSPELECGHTVICLLAAIMQLWASRCCITTYMFLSMHPPPSQEE